MRPPGRQILRRAAAAVFAAAFLAMSAAAASAQASRTIRLTTPFAAGGGSDILARLLADQIGRAQGVTVVVENRPGGGTVIATEAMSRAAPDGNSMLIVGNSFVINPNLKPLNYDPLTSFEPICHLTRSPNVVVVHAASRYRTLADLVDAARARPGQVTVGVNGPATSQQIGFEMLKRAAGVDLAYSRSRAARPP
jgi:tripartite-type tricarboxylate transporter receptor subunit TctC